VAVLAPNIRGRGHGPVASAAYNGKPITGILGRSRQRGPGAEPLVRESGGVTAVGASKNQKCFSVRGAKPL